MPSFSSYVPDDVNVAHLNEKIAGEDLTNDVMIVTEKCSMSVIDLSTDASTTINSGTTLLMGIYTNTTIGTAAVTIDDNTTVKLTLPVNLAAGTSINCYGALFSNGLVVNPADNTTGSITVFYRDL